MYFVKRKNLKLISKPPMCTSKQHSHITHYDCKLEDN